MVTLASHLEHHGPLSTRAAFSVLWQVSHALDLLHDRGLVMEELTPEHVTVVGGVDGSMRVTLTTDATRPLAPARNVGGVHKTPPRQGFRAPEYVRKPEGPPTKTGDTFALGMLAYAMCTRGPQQFGQASWSAVVESIAFGYGSLPTLGDIAGIPEEFASVIAELVRLDPSYRMKPRAIRFALCDVLAGSPTLAGESEALEMLDSVVPTSRREHQATADCWVRMVEGSPRLVRSLDQRLVEWSQTESHRALAVHVLLRMGRMGDVNRERIGLVSASMNTLERGEMASVIADALAGQGLTVQEPALLARQMLELVRAEQSCETRFGIVSRLAQNFAQRGDSASLERLLLAFAAEPISGSERRWLERAAKMHGVHLPNTSLTSVESRPTPSSLLTAPAEVSSASEQPSRLGSMALAVAVVVGTIVLCWRAGLLG